MCPLFTYLGVSNHFLFGILVYSGLIDDKPGGSKQQEHTKMILDFPMVHHDSQLRKKPRPPPSDKGYWETRISKPVHPQRPPPPPPPPRRSGWDRWQQHYQEEEEEEREERYWHPYTHRIDRTVISEFL